MAQKRKNYQKWLWWGGGLMIVAIIGLVILGIMTSQNSSNENKNDETRGGESSEVQEIEGVEGREQTEEEKFAEEEVEKKRVKQYEGEDPNEAEELYGVITYAGVSEGVLIIRTSIDQYLTAGTCELTLSRGGVNIYNSIANIVGDVTTATCEGFDISVAELGEGDAEITINLNAGERKGIIRGEVGI